MNVLSIQSHVVYGHVGNQAATLPLQRLGHAVWPIHTVRFSNHPGHGGFAGRATEPAEIVDLVQGLEARGFLARCDAVLSGYVGAPETVGAIAAAVDRVKAANPDAVYCCDPVIGDAERGAFVRAGVAEALVAEAIPRADILMPNAFEAARISGIDPASLADAADAAAQLRARGPGIVVIKSLARSDAPQGEIETFATDGAATWLAAAPRLDLGRRPDGAGDLFAAIFLGHWLDHRDLRSALGAAAAAVHGVLARTLACGTDELALIVAQDEIVAPTRPVLPVRIG
ncbi:MAG: pyridoxal kinase PdxY [Alphaproteobacteria bacterium]|nr:pyridoxal kinase PdxY [Alphaproteobacteria bacterium]